LEDEGENGPYAPKGLNSGCREIVLRPWLEFTRGKRAIASDPCATGRSIEEQKIARDFSLKAARSAHPHPYPRDAKGRGGLGQLPRMESCPSWMFLSLPVARCEAWHQPSIKDEAPRRKRRASRKFPPQFSKMSQNPEETRPFQGGNQSVKSKIHHEKRIHAHPVGCPADQNQSKKKSVC
jgi:hypothetical protein